MRPLAILVLLTLLCASLLAQGTNSTGAANATGGYITPLTLYINASFDNWFFFYGNASANASSNTTLVLNSSVLTDSSDNTRLLNFQSTYVQYIISDSPYPFNGSFQSPDSDAFNAHFNLSGLAASQNLFNLTHNFSVMAPSSNTPVGLNLPAVDLQGYDTNGSLHPYYEGIAQTNSSFVFLVPISRQTSFDNRSMDYEFVLPFYLPGRNTFYIFSQVAPPSNTHPSSGGNAPPVVNYQWSYNTQSGISFHAPPGATVILHDSLGRVYNLVADSSGALNLAGIPPGTYALQIMVPGMQNVSETLYIPNPVPIPNNPSPSDHMANIVTLQQTPQGEAMCIGSNCYLVPNASVSDLQKLSELSCSGSICRLVGESETMMVLKYHLQPTNLVKVPPQLSPPPSVSDLSGLLSSIGPAFSAQFGGTADTNDRSVVIVTTLALVAAGLGILSFLHPPPIRGARRRGGYG